MVDSATAGFVYQETRVAGLQATEDQLRDAVRVLDSAFDGWPVYDIDVPPVEHLRWKLEGPGREPGPLTLTEVDGRVVYVSLGMRRWYLVKGERCPANDGADLAILKSMQGQGLYSQRTDDRRARPKGPPEHDLNLNFTRSVEVIAKQRPDRLSLGNQLRIFLRPLRPGRLAGERSERTGGGWIRRLPTAAGLAGLCAWSDLRAAARRMFGRQQCAIRQIHEFDERIDGFAEEASRQFDFIQLRDRRYLNWRFCDRRGGASTVAIAEAGDELLGYIAFRTSRGRGYITDLLASPEREDAALALVEHALGALRRSHVSAVSCWLPGRHPYAAVLRAAGFLDSSEQPALTIRARRLPPEELAFLQQADARVHVMHGDSDWI